jgi:tetraacyldisaccharide 4'-kinase
MNPLEYIYLWGYRYKTKRDLKRQKRLPLPVISVGNLTTGGTGKTPAVIAIAMEARSRGLRPCVLTRGYGGRLRGPVFVSEENYAGDVGDEPLMIASRLHDVPVVKCPDRHEGGMFALDNLEDRPGLFILDDGFQHRRLYRDMDVVLVSSLNPFGNGRLLPLGRLRGPLEELSRSGALVITKVGLNDEGLIGRIKENLRRYNPDAPLFISDHESSGVIPGLVKHEKSGQGGGSLEPLDWLSGRKVYAFCAIAEPDSFIRSLTEAGAVIAGSRFFRDHHKFRPSDMVSVLSTADSLGAHWIMTTEKDIMRLRALMEPPPNCAALSIGFRIEQGFYDHIFENARESDA